MKLGPWHLDVEVAAGWPTRAWRGPYGDGAGRSGDSHFVEPRHGFKDLMTARALTRAAWTARAVLDCACNCGGYLFWARAAAPGTCFGFDVRVHWISPGALPASQ